MFNIETQIADKWHKTAWGSPDKTVALERASQIWNSVMINSNSLKHVSFNRTGVRVLTPDGKVVEVWVRHE